MYTQSLFPRLSLGVDIALEGLHHITAITADAPANVAFYARVLGLRLVKKTVNFDSPDVYHLYYGDEHGAAGSILTFFEFPHAARGRAGAGMAHRIDWRVATVDALAFWAQRLHDEGVATRREGDTLHFADPEGLTHALVVHAVDDPPLIANAGDVPAAHALQGFDGVAVYGDAAPSARLLGELGFVADASGQRWDADGLDRKATLQFDPAPAGPGVQGAGTIHHLAWSLADDAELALFADAARRGGARATPIIDRHYFHSVYFPIPTGVLFELATRDIGFDVDEPLATLGTELKLPSQHEPLRARLEASLMPLPNPRAAV